MPSPRSISSPRSWAWAALRWASCSLDPAVIASPSRPRPVDGTPVFFQRCRLGFTEEDRMAKPTARQRRIEGRVLHEFKHGELKSGKAGKAGKVKSRKQAIAIALNEAGASKYKSPAKNRSNLAKTKRKEARGQTAEQEREGKSHVGARKRSPAKKKARTKKR